MSDSGTKGRDGGLAIQVLGREYLVGCPPGEEARITASVEFLNERIRQLRDTGKVAGNEKLAIMAALNIAHDLLAARRDKPRITAAAAAASGVDAGDVRRRIVAMQEALETALGVDQDKLF